MEWIKARLREDSTRSGIGQLAVIVLVACLLLGVDVQGLLTQAQLTVERTAATAALAAGLWSSITRIVSIEPPKVPPVEEIVPQVAAALPQLDPAVAEALKRLAAHLDAPR